MQPADTLTSETPCAGVTRWCRFVPNARNRKCFKSGQGHKKREVLLERTLSQITSKILTLNLMTNQVQRCEEEGQTVGYEVGGVAKPAPVQDKMKIAHLLL